MAGTIDFKYRAFLSYSHHDTRRTKWLHNRLETFPMRGLAGRDTPLGPVPKTLRPIFRDREDFSAGHGLTEQTIANLDGSAALVVLCSPASAQSHYVNEEVRLFKARHPKRPVVPVIVDGKPGDPNRECFAPALRFQVDASGAVTERSSEVLAADLREEGDGRELALAKVVAALIGVPSDEVFRRAERERKRQGRIRNGTAAAILLLTLGGGYFLYSAQHRGAILIDTAAACTQYLPKDKASAGPQDALGQCITALQTLQKGAATDPRDAEILKLIGEGKNEVAEKLQLQVAREDQAAGIARSKKAAERYRGIAATAGLADPKKSRDYYAEAAKLDPDNVNGMAWHGYMEQLAGNLAEAERAYSVVLVIGIKGRDDHDLYWATLGLGDIRLAHGNLAAALATHLSASDEARRLAKADPGSANWQRNLSVSYQRIGELLERQGDLAGALASYNNYLAIADHLAKADAGKAEWQRDPSVARIKVGDVLMAQGDFAGALASYKDGLAIFDHLAKADPGDARWQHDLSVAYNKVGDVLMAQGDLARALASYRDSLAIRHHLAKVDPGNLGSQRDLSVAYNKVGDVLMAQGDFAGALASHKDSLAIRDSLARADPGNLEWQRDLSVAYNKVGDVLMAQGDLAGALASHKDSLTIADHLAKANPGNLGWQRDLSVTYHKVGDVLKAQGDLAGALASHKDSLTIADHLAKANPGNAEWQYDLALDYWRLADSGDNPKENWTKVVVILKALNAAGRLAPANKKSLARAEARLAAAEAEAALKAGDYTKAAALMKERAHTVEKAETAESGKVGTETANALGNLAMYELFERHFEAALAASERALSLAPDEVWLATNQAHALMFLGRVEEARTAYLQHRDDRPDKKDNETWEEVVLKDFAEFEKRGLTHPQMAEIRALLAAPVKAQPERPPAKSH